MKLDHDFFVARYRALGTDELFEQLHGVELSDTALAALTAVLVERGMSDDDMLARHRAATRTRIPSARAQNLCDNCGRSLAGGMIEDCGSRLCSAECVRGMRIFDRSKDIDVDEARNLAMKLRAGECPRCGRDGGTPEMRRAHYIYSYIKGYSEAVETRLCCRRCGRGEARRGANGQAMPTRSAIRCSIPCAHVAVIWRRLRVCRPMSCFMTARCAKWPGCGHAAWRNWAG